MNARLNAIATLCVFSAIRLAAQNPDLPFVSGSTGADGPFTFPAPADQSYAFGLAYDEKRQETIRFGGISGAGTNAETWVMRSTGWQKLTPATSPPVTAYGSMAYDAVREEVVLLTTASQTWTWNGTTWTQKSPVNSPPSRSYAAMCWDAARLEVVLFGGQTGSPGTILRDTWTWNGTNWTQKFPLTSPSARAGHSMAYYPPLSSVALASGTEGGLGILGVTPEDLWLWNGSTWTQQTLSSGWGLPSGLGVQGSSLVYDPIRSELLLFGGYAYYGGFYPNSALKGWNHARTPSVVTRGTGPSARWGHGAVWDSVKGRMVLTGGRYSSGSNPTNGAVSRNDSWYFADNVWNSVTGPNYVLDLEAKADAIWHYTSINIPTGVTVRFYRNKANTPVVWLASEGVTIAGTIDLSGQNATLSGQDGNIARGGPGGYNGGDGSAATGAAAQAGAGPGGGIAGTVGATTGGNAALTSTYVSPFGIPLLGGSGGGGAHVAAGNGSKGGGGGGAMIIASSTDINLTGTIKSTGGTGNSTAPVGGHGGGGTIRLMADRVLATGGTINAAGGAGAANAGMVRLEGFVRQTTPANISGNLSQSVPVEGSVLAQAAGRLSIKSVHGLNVAAQPTGSLVSPDVVFSESGVITIVVEALNIPNGTPVTLTINHTTTGMTQLPPTGQVTLQNGLATFTTTVAAGTGTLQAFATYTVGQAPPAP